MLILYGPNGDEIEIVEYRMSIGFIQYPIPIEEEGDSVVDCVAYKEVYEMDEVYEE